MEFATPISMAAHLAGYISDPSTIRVRVLSEFGRAPSVDQCRNLVNEKRRKRAEQPKRCNDRYYSRFKCGHPRADENTVLGDDGVERCGQCEEVRQEQAKQAELERIRRWKAYHLSRKLRQERLSGMVTRPTQKAEEKIVSGVMGDVLTLLNAELDKRRTIHSADIKSVAAMLLRKRGMSFPMIARQLGYKDHTSVIHLCKTFPKRAERNPKLLEVLGILS